LHSLLLPAILSDTALCPRGGEVVCSQWGVVERV